MAVAASPSEPTPMQRRGRPSRASLAWMAICAFVLWLEPSVGQLWKYLGPYGSVAACCVAAGLIFVAIAWVAETPPLRTTSRPLLLIAMLLGLMFVLLYPISKSGLIGAGSDRADALNVALRALLAGHQPYRQLTYLRNPLTPLPGALLLALPFYLLGTSALQNLFWAPVLIVLAPSIVSSSRAGVSFLLMFIVLCPGALQDFDAMHNGAIDKLPDRGLPGGCGSLLHPQEPVKVSHFFLARIFRRREIWEECERQSRNSGTADKKRAVPWPC